MKFGNTTVNFDQEEVINVKKPVFIEAFVLGMNMYYDHINGHALTTRNTSVKNNQFAKITGIKWARAICSQGDIIDNIQFGLVNLKDVKESFEAGMQVAQARYNQENPPQPYYEDYQK